MTPDDILAPGHHLAEGFAERAATWARHRGASSVSIEALRSAAYAISRATTQGHACLPLGELERADMTQAELRAHLLESRVVGTPAAPGNLPLVLDETNRLYLHRYFDYERRLAARLMARASAPVEPAPAGLRDRLDTLFAGNAQPLGDRVDWQKIAVAMAMMRKLTIVSGGPGTGKTTTVVNLLACLLAQDPAWRIALAAPTGKAAARMLDAIRARSHSLPEEIVARFPVESFTIHRLIGASGSGEALRHHAGNPLALDVLVVDEASMLDLALATRLFEAVPDDARVILLGDKDQLAAVEAGAVFAEVSADPALSEAMRTRLAQTTGIAPNRIVPPASAERTPLQDCVVWFSENFRFDASSGIGRLAALVNAGEAEQAIEWLGTDADPSVHWIDDGGRTPSAETMARIQQGYRPYLEALRTNAEPLAIFDAFNRFRVLCAERAGPRGVAGMNDAIGRWFRAELDHPRDPGARATWYPGQPLMVLRNDHVLRLYNGDVGIVLPGDEDALSVVFPDPDGTGRRVSIARLPEHEPAFATTVHKAQGSEFDELVVVLPSRQSAVLTRELAYTAVTRGRSRVAIASDRSVLAGAMTHVAQRRGGLLRL